MKVALPTKPLLPVPRNFALCPTLPAGRHLLFWFLALAASILLPLVPAHGSGSRVPALNTLCLSHHACAEEPANALRCTKIEHEADHQALPQTGKLPPDAFVPAGSALAATPSVAVATWYAVQPITAPVFLTTGRLRL